MKQSYLFLAEGFEEVEALTVVDIMRRASIDVATVSIHDRRNVTGAHAITVEADLAIQDVDLDNTDWLICPGGLPGATYLHESATVNTLLAEHNKRGGHIAAICASPAFVLAEAGVLDGKRATGYPGCETTRTGIEWTGANTTVSSNVVTGKGPAAAMEFALAIVRETLGEIAAAKVAAGLLYV